VATGVAGVSRAQVACLVLEEYGEAGFMVRALGFGLETMVSALKIFSVTLILSFSLSLCRDPTCSGRVR